MPIPSAALSAVATCGSQGLNASPPARRSSVRNRKVCRAVTRRGRSGASLAGPSGPGSRPFRIFLPAHRQAWDLPPDARKDSRS